MPIYNDPQSPVGKSIPLLKTDIERMRGAVDDKHIAAKAYNLDPGFRKAADFYRSQQLDPSIQKDLPSMLLNRYYFGKWELEKKDQLTSELAQESASPQDPFNPFSPQNQVPQRPLSELPIAALDAAAGTLPVAGSIIGGIVGAGSTIPTGPGAVAGGAVGAGIGAGVGETGKQALQRLIGTAPEMTIGQELKGIATQSAIGGASELGGQLLTKGATKLAQMVGPALKESALSGVGKVLAPTTKTDKAATQKIAQQVLDRPLADTASLTRKGMMEKAAVNAEEAGQKILEFPKLAGKSNTEDILRSLDFKKADFMVGDKVVVPEAIKKIDDVKGILSQFGDVINDSDMQKVGRILSKEVAKGKNAFLQGADEASKVEMQKVASNAIRSTLAEKYPDLAKLNKEFSFWKTLEDVLTNTVARKTGQSSGIIKNIATIGGAVSGATPVDAVGRAAAMRWITTVVQSPSWGLVSAKLKNNLADAMIKGTKKELMAVLEKVLQGSLQFSFSGDQATPQ